MKTMYRLLTPALALSLFAFGCEKKETAPKDEPAKTEKSAKKKDDKPTKKAKTEKKKDGPRKWEDYPGPKEKVDLKGKKAWAVLPIGKTFKSLKFCQYDYVKQDGTDNVFKFISQLTYVPGVFTQNLVETKGLKVGDPVLFQTAASAAHGLISAVDGDNYKVKYYWGTKMSERKATPTDVIKMEGKLSFGESVAYKKGSKWMHGQLVHKGAEKTWVVGFAGKPEQADTATLKAVDVTKKRKVGDKVHAVFTSSFSPGEIAKVLDDGLRYEIKWESGKPSTMGYEYVSSPLD